MLRLQGVGFDLGFSGFTVLLQDQKDPYTEEFHGCRVRAFLLLS